MLNNSCVYPTDSKKYHEPICYEVLSFRCLFVPSLKVDFLCNKYIQKCQNGTYACYWETRINILTFKRDAISLINFAFWVTPFLENTDPIIIDPLIWIYRIINSLMSNFAFEKCKIYMYYNNNAICSTHCIHVYYVDISKESCLPRIIH